MHMPSTLRWHVILRWRNVLNFIQMIISAQGGVKCISETWNWVQNWHWTLLKLHYVHFHKSWFKHSARVLSKLQNVFVQNVFLQAEVEGLVFSRPRRVNWGLPCQKPSCRTSEAKLHSVPKAHTRPDKTISKAEGLSRISFTILYQQRLQGKHPTFALGEIASPYYIKTMSPGKTSNNQNRTFFSDWNLKK